MSWLNGAWHSLFDSPVARIAISTIFTIVLMILAGAVPVEISSPSGVQWKNVVHVGSFWTLLVVAAVWILYQRRVYLADLEIVKFRDADYCRAYMRSRCLPELAAQTQRAIRDGNDGAIKQAMNDLKNLLR